jgi:hypothetical protein
MDGKSGSEPAKKPAQIGGIFSAMPIGSMHANPLAGRA